jgi:hypothetical protein
VEDAFGTWLAAAGVIGLVLLAAWLVMALRSVAAGHRLWLLVGSLGLLVSSLFVPLFLVFPIGFFFVVILGAGSCPPVSAAPLERKLDPAAAGRVSGKG